MTGSSSESEQSASSKTKQFDFTALETDASDINMELLQKQLDAVLQQESFQNDVFGVVGPALHQLLKEELVQSQILTPEVLDEQYREELARGDTQAAAGDEVLQMSLERLRAGYDPPTWDGTTDLTQEQRDLINQNTASQLQMGTSNINKYAQDVMQMITEELAPSRGLRRGDSPIQDRGFRVGEEAVRQMGQLQSGLSAQASQQMLDYPLQTSQLGQSGTQINQNAFNMGEQFWNNNAQFQQQMAQSGGDFLKNLRQQSVNNRMQLIGLGGNLGIGAAGIGPDAGFQQSLKPQLKQTSKSSGTTSSSGGGVSDMNLKKDFESIDHQAVLEAFEGVPVERWRYVDGVEDGGDMPHIGTYAQDFKQAFGLGDGHEIGYMDAIGVLMAAVRALKDRVEELEARNG